MLLARQTNNIFDKLYFDFGRRVCRLISHLPFRKESIANMNKAYYRYTDGAENFDLSFMYVNSERGVSRQFNFNRQSKETIGTLIGRINTNVEKVLSSKMKKKNKKSVVPVDTALLELDIKLLQRGNVVPNDAICVEIIKPENMVQLKILESIFEVIINAPWITALQLPTSMLAGFSVYPTKFEGFHYIENKCKFQWFTKSVEQKLMSEWKEVGTGYTYFPSADDIGKHLKLACIPGNDMMFGPEVEAISSSTVEAGPGACPFESRHMFTCDKLSRESFRVMSYNILADLYCDSDFTRTVLHPYCPPYALQLDYRKQLYIKEILGYNSDIICLQEVDAKVFNYDIGPVLRAQNYDGVFTKKGGSVTEGLACFVRSEKFSIIDKHCCIIGEELKTLPIFESIWTIIKENKPFVARIAERATAIQAVVLQSKDNPNEIVIVGNTHLYFHPDADHVRLTQGGLAILWLNNIIKNLITKNPTKRISLLLCGDFNSVPSCGIFQLYTTGSVSNDLNDWKSNEEEAVVGLSLSQPTLLASACGTPQYTNFTPGFADCLDYIFYEKENISVIQIIPPPTVEELHQNTGLPSVVFPSDHIAQVADLKFN